MAAIPFKTLASSGGLKATKQREEILQDLSQLAGA